MASSYGSPRSLHLDLVPGISLGPFKLGDCLWKTVEVLRSNRNLFNHVEVTWEEEKAISSAVILSVDGLISLLFPSTPSPHPQILQRIDLTIPPSPGSRSPISADIEITYKTQVLHSTRDPLDLKRISMLFGPAFRDGDRKQDIKGLISYPGIGFEYPSAASLKGTSTSSSKDAPAQQITKLRVFQSHHADHRLNEALMTKGYDVGWDFVPNEVMMGTIRQCEIKPGRSVTLHFHASPSTTSRGPLEILLHSTTAQDLLLDLGTPSRKFLATDDRFDRLYTPSNGSQTNGHPASNSRRGTDGSASRPKGCWWNYFHLGLDFLVDNEASDGEVIKIMIHSNIPGTALFQRYARCPWTITISPNTPPITLRSTLDSASSALSPSTSSQTTRNGTGLTTMSLDRTDEPGLEGVINVGTSRIWAIEGLVMEESESEGIVGVLVC